MSINQTTIESTIAEVNKELKENKELSSSVKALFSLLLVIIKVLLSRIEEKKPKPKKPKPKESEKESTKKESPSEDGKRGPEELEEEIAQLKGELEKLKLKEINKEANKPSSKQAEWEVKGVGNDEKGSSGKKGKKKKKKGSGNKRKTKIPTVKVTEKLKKCPTCGYAFTSKNVLESSNSRIIEDLIEPSEPEVKEVVLEKCYCPNCQKVMTAKTELALPGTDIGLNATTLICYFWVSLGLPFTRLSKYLKDFFNFKISPSGLSRHVIRLSKIFQEVYNEILEDVQRGSILFADETGWRVKGKLWWLWVFGTSRSAYFSIDKSRGGDVVLRILGEIFPGVL